MEGAAVTQWNAWAAVKIADMDRDGSPDVVLAVSAKRQNGDVAWVRSPADPTHGRWVRHTTRRSLDSVHSVDVAT